MPSQIDVTIPVSGKTPGPTTASVRLNFQRAYNELSPLIDANLPTRMTTAEGGISSLATRITTAETKITALEAAGPGGSGDGVALAALATRVTLAEGNITSLLARMGTAESNISALQAAGPGGGLSLPSTVAGTGALTLNTSGAPTLPSVLPGTVLRVATAGAGNHPIIALDAAGGVAVPRLQMRSAGGSFAGISATQSGVQIGWLEWMGHDGTDWRSVANIQCISTANFGANRPLRMEFQITRTGQAGPQTTMYLGAAGGLVVGNPVGADRGVGAVNAQTLFSQFDTSVGGTLYIKGEEVSLGAPNSGGGGYSVLRVPNP